MQAYLVRLKGAAKYSTIDRGSFCFESPVGGYSSGFGK